MKKVFNPFTGLMDYTVNSISELTVKDHHLLDGLGDDDHTQYLLASGTRQLTGDWNAGNFEIQSLVLHCIDNFIIGTPTYSILFQRVDNIITIYGNYGTTEVSLRFQNYPLFAITDTDVISIFAVDTLTIRGGTLTTDIYGLGDVWIGTTGISKNLYLYSEQGIIWINPNKLDSDFRIDGDNIDYVFYVDAYTDRVGIGTNVPDALFDVNGISRSSYFISDVAIGTSPFQCTSTTLNTNLNADMLDSKHVGTSGNVVPLLDSANTWSASQKFITNTDLLLQSKTLTLTGSYIKFYDDSTIYANIYYWISGVAGTAGLYIDSTVDIFLNADSGAGYIILNGTVNFPNDKILTFGEYILSPHFKFYFKSSDLTMQIEPIASIGMPPVYPSAIVFNEAGVNTDFKVEGDTDANLFFIDASTDRVGIGKNNPSTKLDVVGVSTSYNFISNVAIGTSPFQCTSTTLNTNLNADMLDNYHVNTSGNAIPLLSGINTWSGLQTFDAGAMLKDNDVLAFGDDSDATIVYDGTNLLINPKVVGSGTLRMVADGKIELRDSSAFMCSPSSQVFQYQTTGKGPRFEWYLAGTEFMRVSLFGLDLNQGNSSLFDFQVRGYSAGGVVPFIFCDVSTGQMGIGTNTPATSAKLDINTTTGALLLPRLTTAQRDALTPSNGMIIYNTDNTRIEGYENGAWVDL